MKQEEQTVERFGLNQMSDQEQKKISERETKIGA